MTENNIENGANARRLELLEILSTICKRSESILEMLKGNVSPFELIGALNPDVNGTVDDYLRLKRVLLEFHRGEIEAQWLTDWHSSSMRLLDELARRYPAIISLNHCKSAQCGLYSILHLPDRTDSDDEFHREIANKMETLKQKYRANSDALQAIVAKDSELGAVPRQKKKKVLTRWHSRTKTATAEVIREINRRYEKCEGRRSRMSIVKEMRTDSAYSARMIGKCDKTWADQASCHR